VSGREPLLMRKTCKLGRGDLDVRFGNGADIYCNVPIFLWSYLKRPEPQSLPMDSPIVVAHKHG
jgi:hypothetical protein